MKHPAPRAARLFGAACLLVSLSVYSAARPVSGDAGNELGELFAFLDRDGDGTVERYEGLDAFLLLVEEGDASGDGSLSESELRRVLVEQRGAERAERTAWFRELDRDGDGCVSLETEADEWATIAGTADSDEDGCVTLDELLGAPDLGSPRAMFEMELMEFLDEVDPDGDGAFALSDLPAQERAAFREDFERFDADRDGRVTRDELMAFLEDELAGASFEVRGTEAVMRGVIGSTTPGRVLELILEHPEVETLVLEEVPGSMDDEANLRAARYVRRRGLATFVPLGGMVASGGTDFFLAGERRSCASGARFGVHSWGGFGQEGADLPRDDPEHERYLDYYREMGTPEAFYWFTLEAAPAEGNHWMSEAELASYGFFTSPPGSGPTSSGPSGSAESPNRDEPVHGQGGHIGGAVLRVPTGAIPKSPYAVTPVSPTSELAPFSKRLNACGIELAATGDVPDAFLVRVGKVVTDIFREGEGIDRSQQRRVVEALYAHRALLPVPTTERALERLVEADEAAFERIERTHSVCDIIMADAPGGQVMEVVEHLLHTITDVGLHAVYPDEWGLTRESELWRAMQRAIELGVYDISGYDDLDGAPRDVRDRILMQEFAYWFITSAWELQEPYGPDEQEWTLRTRNDVAEEMPEFYKVYGATAARVLSAPRASVLRTIGPERR